jgi:predicted nucleic acid-binding protein
VRWISNTGPIVALAKVRKLHLLPELVGEVWIPPLVHRELYGKLDEETPVIKHSIGNVVGLLHRIRQNGYWLSDEVIEIARRLAREQTRP